MDQHNEETTNQPSDHEPTSAGTGPHEPELLLEDNYEDDHVTAPAFSRAPIDTTTTPVLPDPAPTPAVEAPLATHTPDTPTAPSHVSAGVIVLGWLTYAFWGWLIVGLIWLLYVILAGQIAGSTDESTTPYALAATIVMLPIAFFTDFFYRRHEPLKKIGASMVIMIIHAVLFALLAIGSLVTTVFMIINLGLSTDTSSQPDQVVGILTAAAAFVLYAAAFLRTLNPLRVKKLSFIYGISMVVISLVVLGFGIAGPLVKTASLRNDKLIEQHLSGVQSAIDNYATLHSVLPNSLSGLSYDDKDSQQLVKDGLVTYTKTDDSPITTSTLSDPSTESTSQRYQLCVTYIASTTVGSDSYTNTSKDDYSTYLANYAHPAGKVCYKLESDITTTTAYSSN